MEDKGKSIMLICSHYASYEWLVTVNNHTAFSAFGVYKKVKNKYFDDFLRKTRVKFGGTLIPSKEIVERIKENEAISLLGYYGFVSDQSPRIRTVNHFTHFFGVSVPAYTGAEYLAKKFDMNILFLKSTKIKRGYYSARFIKLDHPLSTYPDYAVTDTFLALLEDQIREAPEYYLWTHKRFKHSREEAK